MYFTKRKNMKTKEQILEWLDKQPWKGEFYEEVFLNGSKYQIFYNEDFLIGAFNWGGTKSGKIVWGLRHKNYLQWYNKAGRPTTWEEYCRQNPIKKGECRINTYSNCAELDPDERYANTDANVMSEDLCKAFIAYMKLIQLRNAWVKDCENGDEDEYLKIVYTEERGFYDVRLGKTGLSFPTSAMAEEFIKTFKDLLEVAKPLI